MNAVRTSVNGSQENEQLAELVEEITARLQQGQICEVDDYARRFPEFSERLRGLVSVMTAMADLGHSLAADAPPVASHDEPAPPSASGGRLLGDFRILREIGRGGMGVVYEAEQLSIGRRVALKVLPFAAMLDQQQLNRFRNEARAAGTLNHPHIVAVYSVGVERGVHYYAMHLIEGESLAQAISRLRAERESKLAPSSMGSSQEPALENRRSDSDALTVDCAPAAGRRSAAAETVPVAALSTQPDGNPREYFRTVARLGVQAAEALDHAHQNGVLHRDVKPANLLVDASGKLWVTDFGLARLEADAGMTMTGDLIGTLRYMSPEQALAKRVLVDHRSDVYSLGATLYELLTLQPAFGGDDRQELMRTIAFEEPRRPRQIDRCVPGDLETIVLKAMEKNPADRYATAQALAEDLRRYVDDHPIAARTPGVVRRAAKWSRRHPAILSAATIALLLLAVGSTVSTALLYWEREKTTQANAQSQAIVKFLVNDLLTAPLDENRLERNVTVEVILANAEAKIDRALADQPSVEAFVRATMAKTYNRLRRPEEAEKQARLARSIAAAHVNADDEVHSSAAYQQAIALADQGKFDEARTVCEDLVAFNRRHLGDDHWRSLQATTDLIHFSISAAERGKCDIDKVFPQSRDHVNHCRRALGPEHRTTLDAMSRHAVCLSVMGRVQEALDVCQQTLATAARVLDAEDELLLRLKFNMANDLRLHGRHDEAAALLSEVREANRRIYGARNVATLQTTAWLALTNIKRGQYDEAVALYQDLYDSSRAMLGENHASTIETKYYLAYGLRHQGNFERSLTLIREVLEWKKKNLGAAHPQTYVLMRETARLHGRLGRLDEARKVIDQAIATLPSTESAEREYLAWMLATDPVEGVRDGKRAVELATKACEMTDCQQWSPIDTLAAAHAECGDFKSAVACEEQALELVTEPGTRARYTRHLESYQSGKPWREEP